MSTLSVPVEQDTEVRAITKQATDLRQLAIDCVVTDAQGVEWATAILGDIAKGLKAAEERRVWFVRPLNDHVKAINEFFKGLVAPLADADRTLRNKVLAYRESERQRLAAEQARLKAEADAREAAARAAIKTLGATREEVKAALDSADAAIEAMEQVPPPPAPTVRTALGSTTARRVMDFEVIDKSKVPGDYLVIDVPTVRAAIRAGVREIPGLRIYEKEVLAVKA